MIDFKFGVTLGTIDEEMMGQLRAWRNNKSIWRWCRQCDLITERDQDNWHLSLSGSGKNRMYAIKSASGKLVGVCGLTDIDTIARRAEFSLYIGPEHQRCGHAENALKTLFKHGFQNLGLNLIWGETMDGNPALRLFKKIGMKVEGVRRDFYFKEGEFTNATLISIKRDEFVF
jgi:RimJ/RimL family protein N-acetyltransferase